MTTRIGKTVMMAVESLVPLREAEAIPMDAADREQLSKSIAETGQLAPILISAKPRKDGSHKILDGVNRWRAAKAAGLSEIACVTVETESPEQVPIMMLLGRKKTTAQRVLAYLSLYKEEVLSAHQNAKALRLQHLKKGQCFPVESFDSTGGYSTASIAERLGVDKHDVLAGIEMLEEIESEKDSGRKTSIAEHLDKLLSGQTSDQSLRRWRSAVAGANHTKGKKKAKTNWPHVTVRTLKTMLSAFKAWPETNWQKDEPAARCKGEALELWKQIVVAAPDECRATLRAAVAGWSEDERAKLAKGLKKGK